jgi:hypothetical protein
MYIRIAIIAAAVSLVVTVGCATTLDPILETDRPGELALHRGYYVHGEARELRPCGVDEVWWVRFDSAAVESWVAERIPHPIELGGEPATMYVELEGRLLGPGAFGPGGAYGFEVVVEEGVTVRIPTGDDC